MEQRDGNCHKMSQIVVKCRDVCRKLSWHFFSRPLPAVPFWISPNSGVLEFRKRAEYCFESTVSTKRTHRVSLSFGATLLEGLLTVYPNRNLGLPEQGLLRGDRDDSTMSQWPQAATLFWQAIVTCNLVVLQQGRTKSWFSGRGWGQQLFSFQSPAVHWMARTSSLNWIAFPVKNPHQTPHSLNCLPPFSSLKTGWLRNRTGTGNRNRQNRFSRNRKRNRNRRNSFPGTETGTGTVLSFKYVLKHRQTLFVEEPPEPKTGTDRTFPPPNRTQRAQRSKKFDLDRNFQSRSKFLISLENFNLDVSISPQKIGPRWVARSKISFSIEILNLDRNLEFFWSLGPLGNPTEPNRGHSVKSAFSHPLPKNGSETPWVDQSCADCPGFPVLGAGDAPSPELHPGASVRAPGLAFAFMALGTNSWICCPQFPYHPSNNGTHSTCFCSTRGHTPKNTILFTSIGRHLADFSRTIPAIPQKERFFPNFWLQILKIQSPINWNSIPTAIP